MGDQAFFLSSQWYQRKSPAAPVQFRGTWNADTNTPTLPGTPAEGDLYLVATAGGTSLGGIATWSVGDQALYLGGAWQRLVCTAVPDLSSQVNPALINPIYVANTTTAPYTYTSAFRSVQEKLSDTVSVLDYGADPSGQVDSTAAFRNALANGLSVYVPPGTYLLVPPDNTDPVISIKRSGQVLYGDAPGPNTGQGGGACLVFKSFGSADVTDCIAVGDSTSPSKTYERIPRCEPPEGSFAGLGMTCRLGALAAISCPIAICARCATRRRAAGRGRFIVRRRTRLPASATNNDKSAGDIPARGKFRWRAREVRRRRAGRACRRPGR